MVYYKTIQQAPQSNMVVLITTLHPKVRRGSTEILIPNSSALAWKT
jgi:hypothetical protein